MENIVKQSVWDEGYKNFSFYIANDRCSDKFKEIYIKYLKDKNLSNCFELWCFPWRYLAYISKLWNYEANGADLTPELNDRFIKRLKDNKIKVWNIISGDVFKYIEELHKNKKWFDLTYSLWFIEHFTDFLDVIGYHIKITNKNWYIFITTPNFAWWYQKFMHYWFDRINYNNHVIDSMDPEKWAKFLEKNNCEVLEYWYFWNFAFWVEKQRRNPIEKLIIYLNSAIGRLNIPFPNCRFYSPFCYIIAKKL